MFLDKITESIAFFIGLFQLITEAVRGRQEYESFEHGRDEQKLEEIRAAAREHEADYGPEGYDPRVNDADAYAPRFADPDLQAPDRSPVPQPSQPVGDAAVPPDTAAVALPDPGAPGGVIPPMLSFAPGSVAEFTIQQNILFDRDSLNTSDALANAWANLQEQLTAHATQQAEALQVLDLSPFAAPAGTTTAEARDLVGAVSRASEEAAEALPAADVTFARGADADGITVNGASASEMPDWQSMLPELPERDRDGPDDFSAGSKAAPHTLLTGGNLAQNQVSAVSSGVDAPVIAVRGDVVSLDVISQVNVMRDDAAQAQSDNTMLNQAAFSDRPSVVEGPDLGTTTGNTPFVNVTTLTGDLINYSWTEQINFVGDEDTLSTSISGWESWISTGENELINAESLFSGGMTFDLIIVEGDMTTQYLVSQTNVLADEDVLATGVQAGSGQTPSNDTAEGLAATSGNAAMNLASITHTASDQLTSLTDGLRDVLDKFDPDAPNLSGFLSHPAFEGAEGLNVLHITGDLIKMHSVTQINVLSDGDLVGTSPGAAGQQTETGSNAAVNVAGLTDAGIESVVMAGGSVYSDAVLHQANLVSEDAPPPNVTLVQDTDKALATEAVAFLSDDMAAGQPRTETGQEAGASVTADGAAHSDVMQTMLA